jgi:hypothetical protein
MDSSKSIRCNQGIICSSLEAIEPMLALLAGDHSKKQHSNSRLDELVQATKPGKNAEKHLGENERGAHSDAEVLTEIAGISTMSLETFY